MLYSTNNGLYNMEQCILIHSEEWKNIFLNTLIIKIATLSTSQEKVKLKEVDIHGETLNVVNEALSIFDKFLTNTKEYEKIPIIDGDTGEDVDLYQNIDYKVLLSPFDGFFDNIEVK